MTRIGHGFDAHRFADTSEQADSEIVLGGVKINYPRPLLAHSDGDVVIHALCDALLGALALGDIGSHFPDSDPQFENIDSRQLLRQVIKQVQQKGYHLGNADITIIAQAPKMRPYIADMQDNLHADCQCQAGSINIKATTTEKMGYTGRKEGIAVHAVVLLQEDKS